MRIPALAALAVLLWGGSLAAQVPAGAAPPESQPAPAPPDGAGEGGWSFAASANAYLLPDEANYVQPGVTADRGRLHLEARLNYEDRDTGSIWVGCNFAGGEALAWELTPMLGGVFGNTDGVAPGYRGSLNWRRLDLYSEGEYVFDAGESSDSFFYNWSELSVSAPDWFRVGLVTQRTRVYRTERDIQRGILAGVAYKAFALTAYVFDPDTSRPTAVIGMSAEF